MPWGEYKYCTSCSQRVVKEISDAKKKHITFVAGGYTSNIPPPKYPKFPEPLKKGEVYNNRCRIVSRKIERIPVSLNRRLKEYNEPCGVYIPDDWPMCKSHQEQRWGFEIVYGEDYSRDDSPESGFDRNQVLWLLRQLGAFEKKNE